MPLLMETIILFLLAFLLGLTVGALLWRRDRSPQARHDEDQWR
jgi:hypothetical protein